MRFSKVLHRRVRALLRYMFPALLSAACAAPAALSFRSSEEQYNATLAITVKCSGEQGRAGTGVAISRYRALTAAHVIACPNPTIFAYQGDGIGRPMRVEMVTSSSDIARLVFADDGEFSDVAPVRVTRVYPGDHVCVATAIPTRDIRCGTVESLTGKLSDDLLVSVPVERGNSGSAVYTRNGKLAGIVTQMRTLASGQVVGGRATSLGGKEWTLSAFLLLQKVRVQP